MNYSTKDCKKYLITIYKDTKDSDWKRIKKYKDQENRVARDFAYKDGTIATIIETKEGLKDKNLLSDNQLKMKEEVKEQFNPFAQIRGTPTPTYRKNKKYTETEKFEQFMEKIINEKVIEDNNQNKTSIQMMEQYIKDQENEYNSMFGNNKMPSIYQEAILNNNDDIDPFIKAKDNAITQLYRNIPFNSVSTYEEKFLYIMVNGTQWSKSEGNKASTDFYYNIEENEKKNLIRHLIKNDIDLPNMYLLHIINTAINIESCDETYIPMSVMSGEEALTTMCEILSDIVQHYENNGKNVLFEAPLVEASLYTLESLKSLCSMDEVSDMWKKEDIDKEIDTLIFLIKDKSPKKGMKP